MNILIIGGYGNFGFRLARLLSGDARLYITLAGRNLEKAKQACLNLCDTNATFQPLGLDREQSLTNQIKTLPDVIIDTSGPFQIYGDAPYGVVEYAIEHRCHYLDIADSSKFVSGITKYDTQAQKAGVTVLSGLSTYPCLTSAVLLAFKKNFDSVLSVRAGIAPSPKAGLGHNVIKAITAYAGKPIPSFEDGQKQTRYGLTNGFKYRIFPPGSEPLDWRLFSNVEAPETTLWPDKFPELDIIWLGAGPKPMFLHKWLRGLSHLVSWKLFPSLRVISGMMTWGLGVFRQGAHRGGMFVELSGTQNGRHKELSWHLVAEGDDGPNIPIIPVAITVDAMLSGSSPAHGAKAAVGAVSLAAYERIFEKFKIKTGVWKSWETFDNLYEKATGSAYQALPQTIQDLHKINYRSVFHGEAKVTSGKSPVAWIAGLIFRFPTSTECTPISVVLSEKDGVETWERFFGNRRMVSRQEIGSGQWHGLIVEKFGPISIAMAAVVKNEQMHLITKGWSVFGCPLPRWLAPGGEIYEHETDKRFNFHVDICAPIFGRLVKYEGWLAPKEE